MGKNYKRVNILVRPDQYDRLAQKGVSLSGIVRDLLDDRLSGSTITLSVSKETKALYDHIISNFGSGDAELERHLLVALDRLLQEKGKEIDEIRKKLR